MKKNDTNVLGISRLGDRHANAAREHETQAHASTPPATPMEVKLAGIWQTVLPGVPVYRESNFIAIGGDSLSLAQVITELESAYEVTLTVEGVANNLTLKDMADMVDGLITASRS